MLGPGLVNICSALSLLGQIFGLFWDLFSLLRPISQITSSGEKDLMPPKTQKSPDVFFLLPPKHKPASTLSFLSDVRDVSTSWGQNYILEITRDEGREGKEKKK